MSAPTLTREAPLLGDLQALMAANREAINAAVATVRRTPTKAAIYARISHDPYATEEGTDEQVTDLRRYADQLGIPVVAEYVDNDLSAYQQHVHRDRFEDLMRDAAMGLFDAVLVRHTDRLYRQMKDLTRITTELAPYAQIIALMGGEVNLSTADGIQNAQMLGAVAEGESRRKGERVAANARHRAQNGRMTASTRPFGWAWKQPCDAGADCPHPLKPCADCRKAKKAKACTHKTRHAPGDRPVQGARAGLVPHPTEGPALARVYAMVADGSSLRQAGRWLIEQGFTGPQGAAIRPDQIGPMLKNPRHAGLVSHQGRLVADAKDGNRLVGVDLWQQVQLILDDETRRTTPGRPANTALSGIATCGKCGGPMNASNKHSAGKRLPDGKRAKGEVTPVYLCSRNQHLTKKRALVDDFVLGVIAELVVSHPARLAQEAVTDSGPTEQLAQHEVARIKEQIKGYQRLASQMDPEDLVPILHRLRADLVEAEKRTAVVAQRPGIVRLTAADDVQTAWQVLVEAEDREPLRQVIRELVETVTVYPRPPHGPLPVGEAVQITWQPWARKIAESRPD